MTHAEIFALNEWLTEYPEGLSFDEVCDLIQVHEDDSVVPWIWFETMPPSELVENIDNTRSHFENTIAHMKREGAFA
jgi:hypothetical protein